jgi:microcystin-dependent protein
MARRCGCASDSCSCEIVGGEGIIVSGAGSPRNPYIVTSTVAEIETGVDIQYNNVDIIHDVHQIDFRGNGVTVSPGSDEVVVTVTQPDPVSGYSVPVGAIWMFGAGTPPSGWLICDGSSQLIATYPNLFAVIGTVYGGDGTTNFLLPNLMNRFPIGASGTRPVNGVPGGSEVKSIAVGNLPPHQHNMSHGHGAANTSSAGSHDHQLRMSDVAGTSGSIKRGSGTWMLSGGGLVENAGDHVHSFGVPNFSGYTDGGLGVGGVPLDVMPPYLALSFIIKA